MGVLSLLGKRVPISLRIFLSALAILDDLGSVLIIALFYTSGLSVSMLLASLSVIVFLVMPTWVAFAVVPIFGFANADVSLAGISPNNLIDPVPLGVTLGLLLGKQIGVFGLAALAIRAGLAKLPEKCDWSQLYGVALLCGIGFTMSLFIGALAFPDNLHLVDEVKVGVLMGSILSAVLGVAVLLKAKLCRSQPLRIVPFSKACEFVTESRNSTFSRHAGAGKKHNLSSVSHGFDGAIPACPLEALSAEEQTNGVW